MIQKYTNLQTRHIKRNNVKLLEKNYHREQVCHCVVRTGYKILVQYQHLK